jgi:ubiquinol-cytochrome c reductase cytochrome c1 subunit
MKKYQIKQILLIIGLWGIHIMLSGVWADAVILSHPSINLKNKASLQRGARLFFNYCAGCHSLKYMRYSQMAQAIGLTDASGKIYADLVREYLIYPKASLYAPIHVAMGTNAAKQWFGVKPPDLSLEVG